MLHEPAHSGECAYVCVCVLRQGHWGVIGLLGPTPYPDNLAQTGLLNHPHISEQDGGPGTVQPRPPALPQPWPHCSRDTVLSHGCFQTSRRTGTTSAQHSASACWENVLQFIAAEYNSYIGLAADPEPLCFGSWTFRLMTPKMEVKRATQQLLLIHLFIYAFIVFTHFIPTWSRVGERGR